MNLNINSIPSFYNLEKKDYIKDRQEKSSVVFVKAIALINRLLKDEWDMFLYTKFDSNNNHNYYLYNIKSEIGNVFKKLKRSWSEIGYCEYFEKLDNDSSDKADEIYDTIETAKNRIKTTLVSFIPYHYVDAVTNIVTTYIFATMGNSLVSKTTFKNSYSNIMSLLENYTKVLNIELFKDKEKMLLVDDKTADMLVMKILKILKQ